MKKLFINIVFIVTLTVSTYSSAAEFVPFPTNKVAGVIGASYENGQASPSHPVFPFAWYLGGAYKTWVDFIAARHSQKNYHWLNYAYGGEVSAQGVSQLQNLLADSSIPTPTGPVPNLNTLVIGFWGNDFVWFPYSQTITDNMIANVNAQIATAKLNGVQKIIVTGMPKFEDLDLGFFIALFPPGSLPGQIDQAGYNQVKNAFEAAFDHPHADFIYVNPWCHYKTVDGVHPGQLTSKLTALQTSVILKFYNYLVGQSSFGCSS